MKKILIIGGEGFIGMHIVQELLSQGEYQVELSSRSAKNNPFPELPLHVINFWEVEEQTTIDFLSQYEVVVFTGGADERATIKGKAHDFFYQENVTTCVKLVRWADAAKVKKLIILGSYFTTLNRQHPEWKMAEVHPYVASRAAQQTESIAASSGNTSVIVLELPYIFGSVPHKIPLWKPLIDYVKSSPIIFYTDGGTNMVAVETVAKAVVGAAKYAKHGDCLFVGNQNWTWKQFLSEVAAHLGKKRTIITIPTFIVKMFSYLVLLYFKLTQKEYGLNPVNYINTQASFTYLDAKPVQEYLHYQPDDLPKAIKETVKRCE